MSVVVPKAPVLDLGFSGGAAPPSSKWTRMYGYGYDLIGRSGRDVISGNGDGVLSGCFYNVATYGPNCQVRAKIRTLPTDTRFVRLHLLMPNPLANEYGYRLVWAYSAAGNDTLTLQMCDGTGWHTLATLNDATCNFGANDAILVDRAAGGAFTVYRMDATTGQWTQIAGLTATDTTYDAAGYAGLCLGDYVNVRVGSFGVISTDGQGVLPFVKDTMAGTNGLRLYDRIGENGAQWDMHPASGGGNEGNVTIYNGRVVVAASNLMELASGLPASGDVDVEADLYCATKVAGFIVTARHHPTADSFYHGGYNGDTGNWSLGKRVAGSWQNLDSAPAAYSDAGFTAGVTRHLKLEIRGNEIKLYVDGTLRVSGTDSSFTSGRVGHRGGSASTTTGYHLDNYTASDPSAAAWSDTPSGGPTAQGSVVEHAGRILRPAGSDVQTNGWTVTPPGGSLASCIDEVVLDTDDYIESPDATVGGHYFEVPLAAPGVNVAVPGKLRVHAGKASPGAGGRVDLELTLVSGGTVVDLWTIQNLDTPQTYELDVAYAPSNWAALTLLGREIAVP